MSGARYERRISAVRRPLLFVVRSVSSFSVFLAVGQHNGPDGEGLLHESHKDRIDCTGHPLTDDCQSAPNFGQICTPVHTIDLIDVHHPHVETASCAGRVSTEALAYSDGAHRNDVPGLVARWFWSSVSTLGNARNSRTLRLVRISPTVA